VAGLWRYPVKSMGGEPVDQLRLGPQGVVGDRAFAVALADTGKILTARREPRMLALSARWLGDEVEIVLPDGPSIHSGDPAADDLLGDWLGERVRLVRPDGRSVSVEVYRRDLTSDAELTDFDLPSWGFVDEGQVHVLSEGSLRAGERWHPEGDWDVRRFRPNVLLRSTVDEAVEDGFVGAHVALGQALVEVTDRCKRCVMIALPQGDLPKDRQVLRSVATRAESNFGVYATVRRPAAVHVGDQVVALHQPTQTLAAASTAEVENR
jgi:uncharacterized protein YcbX